MKNRKLIVFVSALLCAVMALSSCTGSASLPNNDEVIVNGPVYENNNNNIILMDDATGTPIDTLTASGKLAVWQKYLKYGVKSLDAADSDSTSSLGYYAGDVDSYGVVVDISGTQAAGLFEELWKIKVEENIRVYNIYGKDDAIFSYKNTYIGNLENEYEVLSDTTIVRSIDKDIYYGIFRVNYENWDAVYEELPEGSTETPELLDYTLKETYYEFYLSDGTLLGKTDDSWDYYYRSTSYTNTFILDGIAYILDNYGNFIKKVNEELYTEDPFIEASLGNSKVFKIGNYYYFEYREYSEYDYVDKYVIFDLDGKYVGEYVITDSDVTIFLPNGNILTQDIIEVSEGATVYDVYDYEDGKKYDVVTKVFDVATGKTTEIELAYIIYDWYDAKSTGTTVLAGDCVVVSAYAFEKQIVSAELSYLALNLDLSVKETLPEIVANQTDLIKIVDADTALIPASMNGYDDFYYRMTNGKIYAYDYVIEGTYLGMLVVSAKDEDGNYCRNLIDYSGKVIVSDFRSIRARISNEDGATVALLLQTYNEKDKYSSLVVCYYKADTDSVIKTTVYTVSDSVGEIYSVNSYMSNRVVRVVTYDYEDDRFYVFFVNAKGVIIGSFYSDTYYSNTTFVYSNDDYRVTNTVTYDYDEIIIKTRSEKNNKGEYTRYTIIK